MPRTLTAPMSTPAPSNGDRRFRVNDVGVVTGGVDGSKVGAEPGVGAAGGTTWLEGRGAGVDSEAGIETDCPIPVVLTLGIKVPPTSGLGVAAGEAPLRRMAPVPLL